MQILWFLLKATTIHHFWADRVSSHTHTHAHIQWFPCVTEEDGCMRRCRASHVRLNNLRSHSHRHKMWLACQTPRMFRGGGQLRNDVNSTNLHVFFSHCEKQAPLPSSSNTHTLSAPSVIKKNKINHKCTTKAEQALQECDDIQHGCIMCLRQRHGPSVSEEGVQRACRTLPPVDGAGITTTAPDDSAVRKQTP